jgi:hypothetical protein
MSGELSETRTSLGPIADLLETLATGSIIGKNEDPRAPVGNSKSDPTSIHFDFGDPDQEDFVYEYHDNVVEDLNKRGIPITDAMSPGDRHAKLKNSLIQEYTVRQLQGNVDRGQAQQNAATSAYLLLDAPPCLLHMENRIGLKMLMLLLEEGLKHCTTHPKYLGRFPNAPKKCAQAYIKDVEQYINQQVFGDVPHPGQWECPIEGNYEKIGTICLDNNRTRKIIDSLGPLLDISVKGETRRQKWGEAVQHYSQAIRTVRRKEDFSPEEVLQWQYVVDKFFQIWVDLHSKNGITNYIHMLASGHVAEYLKYWKSLYAHSQQGK